MKSVYKIKICLLSLWALLCTAPVLATSQPILKVATINVPPMAYMDPETMIVTGVVTHLVQERAAACNVTVAFIFTPSWARAYQMAVSGTADGLIPTTYTQSRLASFDYAMPAFYDLRPSLIVRQDSPFLRFTGLEQLDGKRVGIRAKAKLVKNFDDYIENGTVEIVERTNSKGLAEVLIAGTVDFIVDSPGVMAYHLGKDQMEEKVRVLEPNLGSSQQYLALSKKRQSQFAAGTALSECLLNEKPSR